MQKILFLTQVLPYPLDAGPKIRAYYVLRYLARQHAITLVTFICPSNPPDAVEHLQNYCQCVVTVPINRSVWRDAIAYSKGLLSDMPFLITRDRFPRMEAALRKMIPMKRFGHPKNGGFPIRFLIESDYITGTVININGGLLWLFNRFCFENMWYV